MANKLTRRPKPRGTIKVRRTHLVVTLALMTVGLLYWGAEWCPPCHQLKVTIFKERSFIDRSRLFVPVYLDGDTDSAQRHAERFGVVGYPTMVVLSSEGSEITRIAGGIDIDAYAHVLGAAMGEG